VQQQARILVVEPNDLILGLLQRWLGEAGYTVVLGTAPTLTEAVTDQKPDLIIIDAPTPRSADNIIEAVRRVHVSPILLLSARFRRGTGSSVSLARELGVRNVLPKPFTRGELLSAVSESLSSKSP
jgi:DNA-binding response OmpR family regulator